MIPLDPAAAGRARSWLGPPDRPGLLALHHALEHPRTVRFGTDVRVGLWGNSSRNPRSVLLVREGGGRLEAFGAGRPEPALEWLTWRPGRFVLHAPADWQDAVRGRVGAVDVGTVETWAGPGPGPSAGRREAEGAAGPEVRRLNAADGWAFAQSAPPWALRGWKVFLALTLYGAAFGVPHGPGFAALAWVFDTAGGFDALAVYTDPRFRRLGLGRAAASALVGYVRGQRGQTPLWSTRPANLPSRALARALGFALAAEEPLVRWPPGEPETEDDTDPGSGGA